MANTFHRWLTSRATSRTAHGPPTDLLSDSSRQAGARSHRARASPGSGTSFALVCAAAGSLACASESAQTAPAQNAKAAANTPTEGAAPTPAANEGPTTSATSNDQAAAAPEADENGETRTTKVVTDIVKAHRDEVRQCFDTVEEKYPGIHGDVVIRFVIAPDGHVQSLEFAKSESTLLFQELADCMMAKMKVWKFPPSSLGMESRIGYPFNFNPKR